MARYLGRTMEVLFEGPSRACHKGKVNEWQLMGRTRTNKVLNVPVPVGDFLSQRWVGKLGHVKVQEVRPNSLYGHMV